MVERYRVACPWCRRQAIEFFPVIFEPTRLTWRPRRTETELRFGPMDEVRFEALCQAALIWNGERCYSAPEIVDLS